MSILHRFYTLFRTCGCRRRAAGPASEHENIDFCLEKRTFCQICIWIPFCPHHVYPHFPTFSYPFPIHVWHPPIFHQENKALGGHVRKHSQTPESRNHSGALPSGFRGGGWHPLPETTPAAFAVTVHHAKKFGRVPEWFQRVFS